MNVCESLKAIIKGRGITYAHLSRETGIPIDAISSSLNGKRNLKRMNLLQSVVLRASICKALEKV